MKKMENIKLVKSRNGITSEQAKVSAQTYQLPAVTYKSESKLPGLIMKKQSRNNDIIYFNTL